MEILYEDEVVLVVNKPAGLMVEPDRNGHQNLLQHVKNYLNKSQDKKEVYAQHLHRLDRPVSGIVIFAKDKKVLRPLSEQFAQRQVKKMYMALTMHEPSQQEGRLQHWHRKEKKKAALYHEQGEYMELAILDYQIERKNQFYLWDITLLTGKYHQIRAQLAACGCAILGDQLYGSDQPFILQSIALHAYQLQFVHPISNLPITIHNLPTWDNYDVSLT